jgi:hypothetical protein
VTSNPDSYPDTSVRAAWAAVGLAALGQLTGQSDPSYLTDPDALREIAGDYLGDLLHLLADHRVNIPALLESVRAYYLEERAEHTDEHCHPADPHQLRIMIRDALEEPTGNPEQHLDLIAACIDRHRWHQDSDPWLTGGTEPARDPDAVWNSIVTRLTTP